MDQLHVWLTAQFAEKQVEPNSGLGMAIRYLLKHWERLTLFLRQAGAPLDNNICERALKKADPEQPLYGETQERSRPGGAHRKRGCGGCLWAGRAGHGLVLRPGKQNTISFSGEVQRFQSSLTSQKRGGGRSSAPRARGSLLQ